VFTTIWKNIFPAIAALKSEAVGLFEVLVMHCYITQWYKTGECSLHLYCFRNLRSHLVCGQVKENTFYCRYFCSCVLVIVFVHVSLFLIVCNRRQSESPEPCNVYKPGTPFLWTDTPRHIFPWCVHVHTHISWRSEHRGTGYSRSSSS